MPKIQFANLPRPLWEHILERVAERAISLDLQNLSEWVNTEPRAPVGDWYKDFGSFIRRPIVDRDSVGCRPHRLATYLDADD